MISKTEIHAWSAKAALQVDLLSTQVVDFSLYHLEARFSFYTLVKLLAEMGQIGIKKSTIKRTQPAFEALFNARWERIQDSDAQYLHNLASSVNETYIAIAKQLAPHLKKPYLALLMSSLSKIPTINYVSWSYADSDLDLRKLFLSDDNARLLDAEDVLQSAIGDGQLRHCSLLNSREIILSSQERNRLLSRHFSVKNTFDVLQDFIHFKFYGGTLGSALHRLSYRLTESGMHKNGRDHVAAPGAAEGIAEFHEFLMSLDETTKSQLMCVTVDDDFDEEDKQLTFENLWLRLTKPITTVACKLSKVAAISNTNHKTDTIFLCRGNFFYYSFLHETTTPLVLIKAHKEKLEGMFSNIKLMRSQLCPKRDLKVIKKILGRDPSGSQDTMACVELVAHKLNTLLENHPELYEIDAYSADRCVGTLQEKQQLVTSAQEQMAKDLPTVTHHIAYSQKGDDRLYLHLLRAIQADKTFRLAVPEIVYIAARFAKSEQPLGEIEELCERIVLHVFQETPYQEYAYDPLTRTQALEQMDAATQKAVLALVGMSKASKCSTHEGIMGIGVAPTFFNKRKLPATNEAPHQSMKALRITPSPMGGNP